VLFRAGDPDGPAMTAIFGHRGCTEGFVENTIEAFVEAGRVGADGVEFDVRRSADGALVVHHDAEVPGVGLIDRTPVAELPAHVPLLSAVIEACSGLQMNVEIKNKPGDPGYDPTGALARAVATELVEAQRLEGTIVSSFDARTIEAVRAAEPALEVGWLLGYLEDLDLALARTLDRHYQAIHPFFAGVGADLVARCHAAGVAVNVWTPNEDHDLEAMLGLRVDTVITDRLSAAVALAAGRGGKFPKTANGGPPSG
jgi:glycerophosphoryl diester phosphodiesterase